MLFELVAVGGIIFWLIVAAVLGLLVLSVERDDPFVATITMIGTIAFFTAFTAFNPFTWVLANSGLILLLAVVYLVIGVAWTVAKWYFYNLNVASKLRRFKAEWTKANPLRPASSHRDAETIADYEYRFLCEARHELGLDIHEIPLKVSKNKSRIMTWLVYWPFSALWTLLNDPIRHLYNFVYDRIGGTLQAISDRAFRDIHMNQKG